jgi:signal transduction histidine kinase
MEVQLQLAQKLESIGRLAAGVAHEINTPTQFIADNTRFLADAFGKLKGLLESYGTLQAAAARAPQCAGEAQAAAAAAAEIELAYLLAEIPRCIQQSLDGLGRVARIVGSLKEFAHPGSPELTPSDLNRAIENSIVISRHEWKYVADVATELDPDLPPVPCVVDEFNQVMLNLIINAAHAIGEALKSRGGDKGKITVRTRSEASWAVVEVEDTGTGIPEEIRERIFEPFFTTKPVGKGTGQGLAVVHAVMVKHHQGKIEMETEPGRGTKFTLRIPLESGPARAAA